MREREERNCIYMVVCFQHLVAKRNIKIGAAGQNASRRFPYIAEAAWRLLESLSNCLVSTVN